MTTTYKNRYYDDHITEHPTLKKKDIKFKWTLFKCNFELTDSQKIIEHSRNTHGVELLKMNREQTITVESNASKNPLVLDPCPDVESSSPMRHKKMLTAWWRVQYFYKKMGERIQL